MEKITLKKIKERKALHFEINRDAGISPLVTKNITDKEQ